MKYLVQVKKGQVWTHGNSATPFYFVFLESPHYFKKCLVIGEF